jgi:diaminopimelate epimerase
MKYCYDKLSGAGNDFLIFDIPNFPIHEKKWIIDLCNKQNGIGADGVILVESNQSDSWLMRIFNSDGTEAEMCGNGLRCVGLWLKKAHPTQTHFSIKSMNSTHDIHIKENSISTSMGSAKVYSWSHIFSVEKQQFVASYLNTGVPHVVIEVEDIDSPYLMRLAPGIRYHNDFQPDGVNVNFVTMGKDYLFIRTYERGVERETLACGTGVTAAALTIQHLYDVPFPIKVKVRSNETLIVSSKKELKNQYQTIWLSGPAKFISSGTVYANSAAV